MVWTVGQVRNRDDGKPIQDPDCYRSERTIEAERALHQRIRFERLHSLAGAQLVRIYSGTRPRTL
jgi:rhamnulokinase